MGGEHALRDPINVAIENAVTTLLPQRRAGEKWERNVPGLAREVINAAGDADQFIAWAGAHTRWRFNVAEAPGAIAANKPELAAFVVKSILDELLDREMAADFKAGGRTR